MTIYGQIITGKHLRDAAIQTLQAWSPTYLAEVSEQSGHDRDWLPSFRSWTSTAHTVEDWPEDQLPACIVLSSGLSGRPVKQGDGSYNAEFALGIGVIVSGQDQETTQALVEHYSAAVRTAVLQHPSLGDFAVGLEWVDESYDDLGFDDSRSIAAGVVMLSVEIASVIDSRQGPLQPPLNPIPPAPQWSTVESTNVNLEKLA